MQPKQFTSSFSQSNKLKELGISQETYFNWQFLSGRWTVIHTQNTDIIAEGFAAYSETELAVMLDAYYETYRTENDKWHGGQSGNGQFDTPAQASASRLIWMLENSEDLTAEVANKRLSETNKLLQL